MGKQIIAVMLWRNDDKVFLHVSQGPDTISVVGDIVGEESELSAAGRLFSRIINSAEVTIEFPERKK